MIKKTCKVVFQHIIIHTVYFLTCQCLVIRKEILPMCTDRKMNNWILFQASRTVQVDFNGQYMFTAEENVLKAKSKTLKNLLERLLVKECFYFCIPTLSGDVDAPSYRLHLPTFENDETTVLSFVKFLKAGYIDLCKENIERKFPLLLINAD